MEPRSPAPNFELSPTPINPSEMQPSSTPERAPAAAPEHLEQRSETVATPAPVALPAPVSLTPADDVTASAPAGANPIAASDDDLIEKEWVDRAKVIIQETKDDPYRREQEVSKLQVDYLQKRYGKQLGATEE